MHDIFISYAKEDEHRAKAIAKALEKSGFNVWWDVNIPTGKNFHSVIDQAIKDAKCVIVLWTNYSIISEWVHIEAAEGKNRNILIPLLLEDVVIPLEFRRRQAANFTKWDHTNTDPVFKRLIEDICLLIPESKKTAIQKPDSKLLRSLFGLSQKIGLPLIYIPLLFFFFYGYLISLANHLNIFYQINLKYIIPYNTKALLVITIIMVLLIVLLSRHYYKYHATIKKLLFTFSIPFIFLLLYMALLNLMVFLGFLGFIHNGEVVLYHIKMSFLMATALTLIYSYLTHKKKTIKTHWLVLCLSILIVFFTISQFLYFSFSYLFTWDTDILRFNNSYFINFPSILITVMYILLLIVFKPRKLSFNFFP